MSTEPRTLFSRLLKGHILSISDRHLSIRSHLILLVVAALLPVLVFAGIMFWQHVELQRATVDQGMRDTARALSLAVDREIGQVREVLETLAASPYLDSQDLKLFMSLVHEPPKNTTIHRSFCWIVRGRRSRIHCDHSVSHCQVQYNMQKNPPPTT